MSIGPIKLSKRMPPRRQRIFTRLLYDFSSVWEAFEVLRASLGRLWVALGRLLGRLLGGSWAALGGSQANLESRSPKLLPYCFLQRFFASGPVPVITGRPPPWFRWGILSGVSRGLGGRNPICFYPTRRTGSADPWETLGNIYETFTKPPGNFRKPLTLEKRLGNLSETLRKPDEKL